MSVAVVWSYLHALGADRDVDHARAMSLSVLLVASAGMTTGLTKLRQATARWLVVGTLASLGVAVQVPAVSRFLSLRPLNGADGLLLVAALAVLGSTTFALAARLRRRPD